MNRNGLLKSDADYDYGKRPDDDEKQQLRPTVITTAQQRNAPLPHPQALSPEVAGDRSQRSDVQRHIYQHPLIAPAKEGRDQDEMCRGGDGKKLGNALDEGQNH